MDLDTPKDVPVAAPAAQTDVSRGFLEPVKEVSRNYGDVVKMVSFVLTGGVAIMSLMKGLVIPYFAVAGPAVVLHEMRLVAAFPGNSSLMQLKLSKLRPCKPTTVVLQVTDSRQRVFVVETSWTRPLLVKSGQDASFDWTVPRNITGGIAQGYLSVTHGDCTDSGKAPPPSDIMTSFQIFVE